MAVTGRFGEGVLGPFEDAAEVADVKEDWESPFELTEDPMELTRGEEAPDEYARWGWGSGIEGNLSLAYNGR